MTNILKSARVRLRRAFRSAPEKGNSPEAAAPLQTPLQTPNQPQNPESEHSSHATETAPAETTSSPAAAPAPPPPVDSSAHPQRPVIALTPLACSSAPQSSPRSDPLHTVSTFLRFAKSDEDEDPSVLSAREAWRNSIIRLDAALAAHPRPNAPAFQPASLRGAMAKAGAVTRDYTSAAVFGEAIDQILDDQKVKDVTTSRKIANILTKMYPATKVVLQLVAFGADVSIDRSIRLLFAS